MIRLALSTLLFACVACDARDSYAAAVVPVLSGGGDVKQFSPPALPGSFVPGTPVRVECGIACPDGSALPLLNGVPHAPRLSRPASLGPLPEVVGKYVEPDGTEWWWHADGSTTTSRFLEVEYHGVRRRVVVTEHNAAVDAQHRPAFDTSMDLTNRHPCAGSARPWTSNRRN